MKVRRRSKRYSADGETYRIAQGSHTLVEKAYPSDGAALSATQRLLTQAYLEDKEKGRVEYIVSRVPVLGPLDPLWNVTLHEDGAITTYAAQ